MIRIASFNVENLFSRPFIMNFAEWHEGQPFLDDYYVLTSLLQKERYSEDHKREILRLMDKYGLLATWASSPYFYFRDIRGTLLERHRNQPVRVKANGRADWVGWVELKRQVIQDEAIENTGRVIAEVNPDILVLVEVEDRPTLKRFGEQVLNPQLDQRGLPRYPYVMVIDGNDDRGIDVGILSRYPIAGMKSHIDDRYDNRTIFARDCAEYFIELPDSKIISVLANHFTSRGSDRDGRRRRLQAARVRQIYDEVRERCDYVVVAGDLNDHPESGNLNALLVESDLKDAMSLAQYTGEFPGTYGHATANEKLDYLLLSPALRERVTKADVERRGYYAPTKWDAFSNITKATKDRNQASDHHCLWVDVDL